MIDRGGAGGRVSRAVLARGNQEEVLEAIQDGGLLDGSLQPDADRLKRVAECHAALAQHDKALATYLKLIESTSPTVYIYRYYT